LCKSGNQEEEEEEEEEEYYTDTVPQLEQSVYYV
jgi:hypothetical protein